MNAPKSREIFTGVPFRYWLGALLFAVLVILAGKGLMALGAGPFEALFAIAMILLLIGLLAA